MKRIVWTIIVLMVLVALVGCRGEVPVPRAYQTNVYTTDGGDKMVVASGGEVEVQSGGTLDIQAGATTDFSGGVDLDGATLTWDADADTASVTSADDYITTTLGAAAGNFAVLTGNVHIGNGTPSTSLDGEDAYIEGFVEVDGDSYFGDAAGDTCTITGDATLSGSRDATTGYDYFFTIEGSATGIVNGAKTYGLLIDMDRPAGNESNGGDLDDAGIKVRVETEAITTTAGTVLRGADVEAKADNPSGTVTNLYGGLFSAKSDTGAGSVATMIALNANVQNNATVTTDLMALDARLMRQAATEPTNEYVVQVRNASTSGGGVDAGIYFKSDYSGETDDFDYVLDMSAANVDDADIRLSNGETIKNTTDTVVQISSFFALEEATTQDVGAGFSLTPTGSYQPLTNSTGGSITSDTTTAIVDGAVTGTILVICNEDAQDIVIDDGANTQLGGNVTLTGGADDCLTLLWDGNDWTALAFHDN
jgi:hypothetical protein